MDQDQQQRQYPPPKRMRMSTSSSSASGSGQSGAGPPSSSSSVSTSLTPSQRYVIEGPLPPNGLQSIVFPHLIQNGSQILLIQLKNIRFLPGEYRQFIQSLQNCTNLHKLNMEQIEYHLDANEERVKAVLPKLKAFELSVSKILMSNSNSEQGADQDQEQDEVAGPGWKADLDNLLMKLLFFNFVHTELELYKLWHLAVNIVLDLENREFYLKIHQESLEFSVGGLPERMLHAFLRNSRMVQSIRIADCFFNGPLMYYWPCQQMLTRIYLENVQIESWRLLQDLGKCKALISLKLINITLFGSCYTGEEIILPDLQEFHVHLNKLLDGQGGSDNDDDEPEIISAKFLSLLFFKPRPSPSMEIDLKLLQDGYWQDYFTLTANGSKVYCGIKYDQQLLAYIDQSTVTDLTLNGCEIESLASIPIGQLQSLAISKLQISTAQLTDLLEQIANSRSMKSLLLRSHGPINLNHLMSDRSSRSRLERLTLISTELDVDSSMPPSCEDSFLSLNSLSLIYCNLNQDFTQLFKAYFHYLDQVEIQEFPASCELLSYILEESTIQKLNVKKFNLEESWEAHEEQEGERNEHYRYLKEFFARLGIEISPDMSFELEKSEEHVGDWICNWFNRKEEDSGGMEEDEFEMEFKTKPPSTFRTHDDFRLGILNVSNEEELTNLIVVHENLGNGPPPPRGCLQSMFSRLRILQLSGISFSYKNLAFIEHCPNLIVLRLDNMELDNISCSSSLDEIIEETRDLSQLKEQEVLLCKLEKFTLDLRIPDVNIAEINEGISTQSLESLIWFEKYLRNDHRHLFELRELFTDAYHAFIIELSINGKTMFEFNWREGLVNFGKIDGGSGIVGNLITPSTSRTAFELKTLHLMDLDRPIPEVLQTTLRTLRIHRTEVDYVKLQNSIKGCQNLKELALQDCTVTNIPANVEFNFLRNLESLTFTRSASLAD